MLVTRCLIERQPNSTIQMMLLIMEPTPAPGGFDRPADRPETGRGLNAAMSNES